MKSGICIHNAKVVTGFSIMEDCAVYIEDQKIVDVFSEKRFRNKTFDDKVKIINAYGSYVSPGFIDTHIHGVGGFGTDDMDKNSILKMSEILPRYGVTSFIPTIYSRIEPELVKSIKAVVGAKGKEKGAHILGMHLEGPFISHERLGAQTPESVVPVDLALMDRLIAAAKGNIINMTVAPELKDMRRLALHCIAKNIILQAGHTNATYEQMVEGMQVRIMHSTHLFNAMSRIHHRNPGAVGAILIHPEMSCEIIADGIHIDKTLIKFIFKSKPLDRLVLITDSLKPTGQTEGKLIANGEEVYLDKCFHRTSDDVIAGSALTMIQGVKNLVDFGISIEKAIKTATLNPATILNIKNKGMIAPDYDADLVIFNQNFEILHTIINGKIYGEN
ncbi:MAG: N-acetylglucosamine-6-phosphate deacetylase [Alphaproteobacteria bacterium]|nr:N-acetylglucosamine-6-phosphate deacetylase [Alphaproteobacteria bacterium]